MDQKKPVKRHLTVEDVAQIKAHLKQGATLSALARHFHVHHKTIGRIRDGKSWPSIAPAAEAKPFSLLTRIMR